MGYVVKDVHVVEYQYSFLIGRLNMKHILFVEYQYIIGPFCIQGVGPRTSHTLDHALPTG
jgi:hypothetical protein